jgi:hypothetical protein
MPSYPRHAYAFLLLPLVPVTMDNIFGASLPKHVRRHQTDPLLPEVIILVQLPSRRVNASMSV